MYICTLAQCGIDLIQRNDKAGTIYSWTKRKQKMKGLPPDNRNRQSNCPPTYLYLVVDTQCSLQYFQQATVTHWIENRSSSRRRMLFLLRNLKQSKTKPRKTSA